jgi:hypothetical protein
MVATRARTAVSAVSLRRRDVADRVDGLVRAQRPATCGFPPTVSQTSNRPTKEGVARSTPLRAIGHGIDHDAGHVLLQADDRGVPTDRDAGQWLQARHDHGGQGVLAEDQVVGVPDDVVQDG